MSIRKNNRSVNVSSKSLDGKQFILRVSSHKVLIASRNNRAERVDNLVLNSVLAVISNNHNVWSGTMTDLQKSFVRLLGKKNSAALPVSPSALRVVLNRIANRLRTRGVSVRFVRLNDRTRTRIVRFAR